MKLKIINMSVENCLKLTHRYISMSTLYKDVDPQMYSNAMKKIAPSFMYEVLKIPLIIFLRDEGNVTAKASSEIKGLENLFSTFVLDITYILNSELLILYRLFLQKSQEKSLSEIQINVILINDEIVKDVNFDRYQKMKLLMDFISYTNPNSSSLNVDLLEKIYGENELDFFGLTSIKKLFPRNRKASIVKENSNIKNPWLDLYLQTNKTYLSFENSANPKKEIKVIHCPICALEHKINDELVYIKDGDIHFTCEHKKTQFVKYKTFQIPCADFSTEVFNENDKKKLLSFFKNNIQPININSVYMIQVLKPKQSITHIPLIKYIDNKSSGVHNLDLPRILTNFYCPICNKSHLINFTDDDQEDYIDSNGNQHIHFLKMFTDKGRIEFTCDHKDTTYFMYKNFTVKKIQGKSFRDQAILITERYVENYMDGKKIITWVLNDKFLIIDMANYL